MAAQHPLPKPLRTQLENTVKAARDVAEIAATAALVQLAVGEGKAPDYLTDPQKALRRRLRAHGRALGDIKAADDSQSIRHLVWETAYEHWHRMLFARFLAENGLLLWEPGAPVTLAECEEMAQDPATNLGAKSGWDLAGKLAARMLPQVFKPQHPVFDMAFAIEHQRKLETLLAALPEEVFKASDSLGWVYQFWQAKRKDEVNASEVKIGADELPAVTQLFTEPYMVDFLLHNSLGAWWSTRHHGKTCPVPLTYLRTLDDGTPAAGKFEGWPDTLEKFKLLDPCCGSGHFLVAAFLLLVPMRMAAEGLTAMDAVDLVLQDNLHGLELDARCVEIAVFALALAAWRYPDESGDSLGVRADMPAPNIACCGLKVGAKSADWTALVPEHVENADELKNGLRQLHKAFTQAPILGSLLDTGKSSGDLFTADYKLLSSLLQQALKAEQQSDLLEDGSATWNNALTALGLLDAARLLDDRYNLVITNVPYLARGKQNDTLKEYCETHYADAKNDLANVFLERCLELSQENGVGVVQIVMPQNWLFLGSYKKQRESLLKRVQWNMLAWLGPGAFETISGEVVQAVLLTQTRTSVLDDFQLRGLDVSQFKEPNEKAKYLSDIDIVEVGQNDQLKKPDARVNLEKLSHLELLEKFASAYIGLHVGDWEAFRRSFWEVVQIGLEWQTLQNSVSGTDPYSGLDDIIYWPNEGRMHKENPAARVQGRPAWGKRGVAVSLMSHLPAGLYGGGLFRNGVAVISPKDPSHLPAIWMFCNSIYFNQEVRKIDQKLYVTCGTLVKIPFDLKRWQLAADERFHKGLPKPYTDNPTQWLFHGHPQPATDPLQVAVARLAGYRWPAETDATMELSDEARSWIAYCAKLADHTDDDGIVCLPSVRGEPAAHDRLLKLLIAAWETVQPGCWKPAVLDKLLTDADWDGKGLDTWLREKFFEQHAKRFHHRPFIWHVWDGLKDGFAALVNYHKLDTKNLERLIHTYLGDWIRQQEGGVRDGVDGAPTRLAAALDLKRRLELILEGEKPYDIFVRWKPLAEQPIGWNPDLNDGVRMNIRPFMTAEVLRHNKKPKLNITWDKDRGKDVESAPWFHKFEGDRINDHHLTLAEKMAARSLVSSLGVKP
ncbi:BREX-1 system adenine-specific DNA-methyltransferase PglX [Limnohabitans sp. 2KL-1]|uniref:BREX-1 system adenine-specific DNA-methyltransferase PglX n=1 Tax=Limnohabitans sp. 2KL-1 TaxID=1100699 RepID=UPI001E39450B|nr:BREX-1 system adenine-specific DNA-methyltransferase PglX [Limnohabitans sp. 2KL-1]